MKSIFEVFNWQEGLNWRYVSFAVYWNTKSCPSLSSKVLNYAAWIMHTVIDKTCPFATEYRHIAKIVTVLRTYSNENKIILIRSPRLQHKKLYFFSKETKHNSRRIPLEGVYTNSIRHTCVTGHLRKYFWGINLTTN